MPLLRFVGDAAEQTNSNKNRIELDLEDTRWANIDMYGPPGTEAWVQSHLSEIRQGKKRFSVILLYSDYLDNWFSKEITCKFLDNDFS
jgi:hypothetical protein